MMLNEPRHRQYLDLMHERGWERLLFYGDGWRKENFRCLLNRNFCGAQILGSLHRSGQVDVVVTDPSDLEYLGPSVNGRIELSLQPTLGLEQLLGQSQVRSIAINGMEHMPAGLVRQVAEACGSVPVSATLEIEELRRIKTPQEIAWIRQAARLADRGYEYFVEVAQIGMSEFELVAEVESFVKANGAEDNFMLVASGGTEVTGMKPPTQRRFERGDSITTELTPQINGYYAQICRTLVMGEPNAQQRQAYAIFAEAQQAAQDLLRPGVDISDVARVQNDVFRAHGFGEYTGPQYTRVRGHNLGLYPDELPHVLENVHYICKPNMIVIAHPNTYLPLSGYMVFGDTLLVTEDGCVSLSNTPKKLFQT